jgi:predicted Zn-dependent peptidase
MKSTLSRLPNGLQVISAPLKERKSVAIGVWVRVGGRDETPRLNGISHFLEHMVFKGTRRFGTDEIKQAVEGVGGSLNAFTGEECTCFLAKVSSVHFDRVFQVLAEMVLEPTLRQSDLEKERTVVMEEIKMTQDQPSQYVEELLAELVWPKHALGRPLAGTLDTVAKIRRKDLAEYHRRHYRPSFITVAAAGDVDHAKLLKTAKRYFNRGSSQHEKKNEWYQGAQHEPRMKVFEKKTEQTHFAMAVRAFKKNHPQEFVLDILSVILGGNMSSRLFCEVREKRGLAYEIGSFVKKFQETGTFEVAAGVDNRKAPRALEVVVQELRRLTRSPVGGEELKRAKEFYLGQMELGLESNMNQMLWIGEHAALFGYNKFPQEVRRAVERVSAGDIRAVACSLFKDCGMSLAVIGPEVKRFEKEYLKSLAGLKF